jgi:NAD(P)-dependent dehydrogenase (short-subunit alcohol dehydrogenase family)
VAAISERIALVTGASAGIGFETALGLARAGFRVMMVGRDAARNERACAAVAGCLRSDHAGAEHIETALADFASLAAVRRLAETVQNRHDRLDLLVNNAGIIAPRYQKSQDGYELTVAVNHLAPFLLTNLLLDRLRASGSAAAPSRIITVASQAHRGALLDLATWMDRDGWSPLQAYGRSKLCNILFTRALARRLADGGVVAASLHPGVIATKIGDSAGFAGFGWRLVKPFLASPEKGARTSLFLATTPDPSRYHGAYLIDSRPAQPDPAARDDGLAERLWTESAGLVGL